MFSEKNKIITLTVTLIATAITCFIFTYHTNDDVYKAIPHPRSPTRIPEEHENFKKEILLINLNNSDSDHFIPNANFSLKEINPRHLDYRSKADYDYPWSMDFFPNGDILIAVHHGSLLLYNSSKKQVEKITGLPTDVAKGSYQLGLLDLMVNPNFSNNHKIYFSYTAARRSALNTTKYTTCVIGATLKDLKLTISKRFCANPWDENITQFGGALALDKDNSVLLSVGDRSSRNQAQNIQNTWGKIIRLNEKRFAPSFSNPFTENRFVWSLGHRNPQGLFYNQKTDVLYEVEHGPQGGDEVNIINRGLNYGWPVITYGREYVSGDVIGEGTEKAGMEQPLYYYVPSIATSSIIMYQGNMFPEWRGSLFITSLAGHHLNHLSLHNNKVIAEERFLTYMQSRLRDIKEGPDGAIYILSEDGFIMRLFR